MTTNVATPALEVHDPFALSTGGTSVFVGVLVRVLVGVLEGVLVGVSEGVLVGVLVGRCAHDPVTLNVTEDKMSVLYVTFIVA